MTPTTDPHFDLSRARAEIAALVERYRALGSAARRYSEARTVNEFIIPLFGALGWDVRNVRTPDEVVPEEAVSRGRVDWAFRLGGVPRIYLEAKRPAISLDDPEAARQAINYAYNKGVTWAILCNWEGMRVYNAEWDAPNPNLNLFFEVDWSDYPASERLLWLSRDAIAAGVLDKEAERVGRRLRKTPVGERLFGDLKYSLNSGIVAIWMGDLETPFLDAIEDEVDLPLVDVLFAPHHGRDVVPAQMLRRMSPKLVIIGEAASEHLNYYAGWNTLTQNSAGDILLDCQTGKVHIFATKHCGASFLHDEGRSRPGYWYLGSLATRAQ